MKGCHLGVDPWNCSSLLNPGASLNQTLLVTSLQEDLTHVDPTAGKKGCDTGITLEPQIVCDAVTMSPTSAKEKQ